MSEQNNTNDWQNWIGDHPLTPAFDQQALDNIIELHSEYFAKMASLFCGDVA